MIFKLNKFSIFKFKKSVGIHLAIKADGNYEYSITIIEKSKAKIKIVDQFNSIDLFLSKYNKKVNNFSYSLVITGKQVLFKKVNESDDLEKLIQIVFPGTNAAEFSFQLYNTDKSEVLFMAMLRNNILEAIISKFELIGIAFSTISFGPFITTNFVKEVDIYNEENFELSINNSIIKYRGNNVNSISNELTSIESEQISLFNSDIIINIDAALSFSAALLQFKQVRQQEFLSPTFKIKISEAEQKQIYHMLLRFFLIAISSILVLNIIFFQYWYNHQQIQEPKVLEIKNEIVKKEYLLKQLQQANTLINDSINYPKGYYTIITDKIWKIVPTEINLLSFEFNPVKTNLRKKLDYEAFKIIVTGTCKQSVRLNEFINKINELEFINKTIINSYKQDAKQGLGYFILQINLKKL